MLAAAWAIGLSGTAANVDEGWAITSFHSGITTTPDSAFTIKEEIRAG